MSQLNSDMHAQADEAIVPTGPEPADRPERAGTKGAILIQQLQQRVAVLETIINVEERVRRAANETELAHLIANETRKLVGARQAFVLRARTKKRFQVYAVSSLALVDRDTPFIRWIEGMATRIVRAGEYANSQGFELPKFTQPDLTETRSYPFQHFFWQPLSLRSGEVFAVVLIARERSWSDADQRLLGRTAVGYASVWQSLVDRRVLLPRRSARRLLAPLLLTALFLAGAIPVPMTTLAPVEIVAAGPQRVTAPLEAVIKGLPIAPNQPVSAGDVILRFEDTELKGRLQVAEQELQLAASRHDRARQAAFNNSDALRELAVAKSAYLLKKAERDFAESELAKTVIRAKRGGILIYSSKDRLLGRPVRTGEQLLKIADPKDIEARIEVPVADAVSLSSGATVRLLLDANPLVSISAKIKQLAYHAEPNATQQLVYPLIVRFSGQMPDARIGARGTAQIFGEEVPLAYFLFRRPISAVRQYFGI